MSQAIRSTFFTCQRVALAVGLSVGLNASFAFAESSETSTDEADSTFVDRTTLPRPPVTRPPIGRLPIPRPERPERPDRPVRIDPSKIEIVRKGPSVQFRAFPLKDPSTGQGSEENARQISPQTVLQLPNGKQLPAGEYYRQINEFENYVSPFGHTLREQGEAPIELQRLKINLPELQRQGTEARVKRDPRRIKPITPIDLARAEHTRKIGTVETTRDVLRKYRIKFPDHVKAPKRFDAKRAYNGNWGWSDFGAFVDASVEIHGTANDTRANAQGAAGGSVFGKRLNIIKGVANAAAPATGNIQGNTAFYFLGMKLFEKNHNAPNPLFFANAWEKGLDEGTTIHFALGPIPMSAKIGVRGSAELAYRMNLLALHANADITPQVASRAYVQVGVDVVVGGAGAGGEVVLISNSLPITARMHLLTDGSGPYYLGSLDASDELKALAGKMYAYVFIYVPAWSVPPWRKKQWNWTIFDWHGIQANGSLFSWNNRLNLY